MKNASAKRSKNTKPKRKFNLFLSYPTDVIVTGTFSSADDSIDDEYRTPPQVGDVVKLCVNDPMRAEDGEALAFKVLAVNSKNKSDCTIVKLQLHGGYRIAMSR